MMNSPVREARSEEIATGVIDAKAAPIKRILFLAGGEYVGGQERLLADLMAALREQGVDVVCVHSGQGDGRFAASLAASGLEGRPITFGRFYARKPLWTLDAALRLPGGVLGLARLIRDWRPDAVVATSLPLAARALAAAPKGAPVFLHAHNLADRRARGGFGRRVMARLAGVLAISAYVGASFAAVAPAATPVKTVLNGTRLRPGPTPRPAQGARPARFGIVGQLIPSKGHKLLFSALAAARAAGAPPMRLDVFGDGPERAALGAQVEALGLEDQVRFRGFVDRRDEIYDEIDWLVAAAAAEPFGLTVIEAAMRGAPALAPDSAGFRETIRPEENGLLYRAGDVDDLARRLTEAARIDAAAMGAQACAVAQTRFTDTAMAQALIEALAACAPRRRRSARSRAPTPKAEIETKIETVIEFGRAGE